MSANIYLLTEDKKFGIHGTPVNHKQQHHSSLFGTDGHTDYGIILWITSIYFDDMVRSKTARLARGPWLWLSRLMNSNVAILEYFWVEITSWSECQILFTTNVIKPPLQTRLAFTFASSPQNWSRPESVRLRPMVTWENLRLQPAGRSLCHKKNSVLVPLPVPHVQHITVPCFSHFSLVSLLVWSPRTTRKLE